MAQMASRRTRVLADHVNNSEASEAGDSCCRQKWTFGCKCPVCQAHFVGKAAPARQLLASNFVASSMAKPSGRASYVSDPDFMIGDVAYMQNKDTGVVGCQNPAKHWRTGGVMTFARIPQTHELPKDAPIEVGLVGIPFDSGCTFRPGARFGPESLRRASRTLRPYSYSQKCRPFMDMQCADFGDMQVTPFDIPTAAEDMRSGAAHVLSRAERIAVLGGDHSLSYPVIKALVEKRKAPVALVHLDAHLDTLPPLFGNDLHHGSPFRKCWEEDLLVKDASVHVGIRGTGWNADDVSDSANMGITTLFCESVHEDGVKTTAQRVLDRVGKHPVYLSIDIDVLDPSVAPATGTPEMGGLQSSQLLQLLRLMFDAGVDIVGCDVVEVAPAYDVADITSVAGATLIYEMLGGIARLPAVKAKQTKK